MKRSLIIPSVLALALILGACATTTTTPSLTGTVTAIDANSITVSPAGGQPTSVNVNRGTKMLWYTGVDATRSDLVVGHRVNVWLAEGTQNASKLVITQ